MDKTPNILNMLKLWEKANQLKKTLRYAAYQEDQDFIETTADHTWRMALIAIDICKRFNLNLDFYHIIEIIVFHDLVEYPLEKDIVLVDLKKGIKKKEDKEASELKVIKDLATECDAEYAYDLFMEYKDQQTRAAKFTKFIDKLEAMTHILARSIENNTVIHNQDIILTLCDISVQPFPMCIPLITEIKKQYKKYFITHHLDWDETYETSHLDRVKL